MPCERLDVRVGKQRLDALGVETELLADHVLAGRALEFVFEVLQHHATVANGDRAHHVCGVVSEHTDERQVNGQRLRGAADQDAEAVVAGFVGDCLGGAAHGPAHRVRAGPLRPLVCGLAFQCDRLRVL